MLSALGSFRILAILITSLDAIHAIKDLLRDLDCVTGLVSRIPPAFLFVFAVALAVSTLSELDREEFAAAASGLAVSPFVGATRVHLQTLAEAQIEIRAGAGSLGAGGLRACFPRFSRSAGCRPESSERTENDPGGERRGINCATRVIAAFDHGRA